MCNIKIPVKYNEDSGTLTDADNMELLLIAHEKNGEYHDNVGIDLAYLERAINFYEQQKER